MLLRRCNWLQLDESMMLLMVHQGRYLAVEQICLRNKKRRFVQGATSAQVWLGVKTKHAFTWNMEPYNNM